MSTPSLAGDLTLATRPATAEAFAPYGRVLLAGERLRLGARGSLLALEQAQPAPRRVTHLIRYPEARRVLLPMGPGALLVVVLGPGERPGGPPVAFLLPPGAGVLVEAGTWHAGPVPLHAMQVAELLETVGPADRMDRRTLADLVGAQAARVVLPEEDLGRPRRFHLAQPNALLRATQLEGRVRLGLLELDGLHVEPAGAALRVALEEAAQRLRSEAAGRVLAELPGVAQVRELFASLHLATLGVVAPSEVALDHALAGRGPEGPHALAEALHLCMLRTRVPAVACDADRLGEQVVLRAGAPGEAYPGGEGRRVPAEGRLLLADAEGPFASPAGEAGRARVGSATARALVALFLPPAMAPAEAEARLEAAARTLGEATGARLAARALL